MRKSMLWWVLFGNACFPAASATELMFEDFNSAPYAFDLNTTDMSSVTGASGDNKWIVNAAYAGGTWAARCKSLGSIPVPITVNNTPSQPGSVVGAPNSAYLHILATDAQQNSSVDRPVLNATYMVAANVGGCWPAQNHFARMSGDVSTVGFDTVELQFHWMAGGWPNVFGEVYASTDSGATWNLVTAPPGQYWNVTEWQAHSLWMPQYAGQSTLRFGFRWVNGLEGRFSDPGFALDDVRINAYADAVFVDGFETGT
jgi:hypothetical protein